MIDDICYFDIYPNFELKKDQVYSIEFLTYDGKYDVSKFKLVNVYTEVNGRPKIDVKLKLIGQVCWAYPNVIYFTYE
jgi:hypothetical protein